MNAEEITLPAEQELDKVYHAIPEWISQLKPEMSLSERIAFGFEYQQRTWTESFLKEVADNKNIREFLVFLIKKRGLDYAEEYWNFLIQKDLDSATKSETKI